MNRRDLLKTGLKTGASLAIAPVMLQSALTAQASPALPPAGANGWVSLLNDRDLTGWYTMLQKSGKGVAEAKKMVTVEEEMLHIMGNEDTGEEFENGFLATHQEFENVRIRMEYKWGMKRFSAKAMTKRDNGLLFGLVGKDKVWPTCVECQIEEGDVGDLFLVGGARAVQATHGNGLFGQGVSSTKGWAGISSPAPTVTSAPPPMPVTGRTIKDGNFENLNDWNTVEILWQGDRAAAIINGRSVNLITQIQQPDPRNPGQFLPLTRGKIGIELVLGEIWIRRIEVKSLV